jgi:two-component system, LuxR family, sensor kinase FixL
MTPLSQKAQSPFESPSLELVQLGVETALKVARAGVWAVDLDQNTTRFSDGFYELLGVDPAQAEYDHGFWHSRIHPDDYEQVVNAFSAYERAETDSFAQEYRLRHANGHWLWVFDRGRAISEVGGGRQRIMGFIADVSERRSAFDQLRQSEERHRVSMKAIAGAVYELDLQTNISEYHGLGILLGLPETSTDNGFDRWLDHVHAEDRATVRAQIVAHRVATSDFDLTYRVFHNDGHLIHVRHRGTFLVGSGGVAVRAFGVVEDVTEHRRVQDLQKLQASIIEQLDEGVVLIDRDARILSTNQALDEMFGYQTGELIGCNGRLLSRYNRHEFDKLVQSIFERTDSQRKFAMDFEAACKDGSTLSVQCVFSGTVVGENECVIAVVTDLTDRKRLQRELMQVTTRVQEQIASDLHDGVGQQLAGIAMMLKGIEHRVAQAGNLELRNEVGQIVDLVNDAIKETRGLARGLSPVRADRAGLAEGFEALVNDVANRYHVQVQMDVRMADDVRFEGSTAANLYRIAQEGVLNAAKHAGPSTIRLTLTTDAESANLLISDDGRGFDPSHLSGGRMGLQVMRFRAQIIGGYLVVESRPGQGTTVRCKCPLYVHREVA